MNWENNTDQEFPESTPIRSDHDSIGGWGKSFYQRHAYSKRQAEQKKPLKTIVYKRAFKTYQEDFRKQNAKKTTQKKKATKQESFDLESDSDSEEEDGFSLLKPPSSADEAERKRYEAERAKKAGYEIINDLSDAEHNIVKKRLEKEKARKKRIEKEEKKEKIRQEQLKAEIAYLKTAQPSSKKFESNSSDDDDSW